MDTHTTMDGRPAGVLTCPYCGGPVRWVPKRWFGRGCFDCEQCGEFPDFRTTAGHVLTATERREQALTLARTRDDRPRVLLVDDSAEHRDLYALMLEPIATVITASRGEDALALAAAELWDAIILDVMMPGLDGWAICTRLKSNAITSAIPVIMLTALDGAEAAAPAHRAGASAVLMKPCPIERLVLAIDAACRSSAEGGQGAVDTPAVQQAPTERRGREPTPYRVLIVDEDDHAREGLSQILTEAGYHALTASTFQEAQRQLTADAPDLFITEVRLGDFNGLQLIVLNERAIPAIVLTGFADAVLEQDARRFGAEYLLKPVAPSTLLALIDRTLTAPAGGGSTRRWRRKPVTTSIPTYVDEAPARMLDVSYGGLRVELARATGDIPRAFAVMFPSAGVSIHADLVWKSRVTDQTSWCGATVLTTDPIAASVWRGLVDAIS